MDSHQNPVQKGTYAEFDDMMAALLEEIFLRDSALGEKDLQSQKLVDHLRVNLTMPFSDPSKSQGIGGNSRSQSAELAHPNDASNQERHI